MFVDTIEIITRLMPQNFEYFSKLITTLQGFAQVRSHTYTDTDSPSIRTGCEEARFDTIVA